MRIQLVLQTIGAVLAIFLGVVFFIYLPHDIGDVTTDAFFVGAGLLLLRSTYSASRKGLAIQPKSPGKNQTQGRKKQKTK